MQISEYLEELYNFNEKANTSTPFWSYETLINNLSSLKLREKHHISSYAPEDKGAGLGRTASGIEIKHYVLGSGNKHILILGAEHGNDIINSQSIYYLMGYLIKRISEENLNDLLEEYTFDFVPVLNPEGYIITTSAINYFIKKSTQNKADIESINSDELYRIFGIYKTQFFKHKNEALSPIIDSFYSYQQLFSGIDETALPAKYKCIRDQLKLLHHNFKMPYVTMCNFASNGNGVDLLANRNDISKFRDINEALKNEQCLYNNNDAFKNIPISYPSSKGCPSKGKDIENNVIFEYENENLALLNYYNDLCSKNHILEIIVSAKSRNKLLEAKNYIEYEESKLPPCGQFTDAETIFNTYVEFINNFQTKFGWITQNNVFIKTNKSLD